MKLFSQGAAQKLHGEAAELQAEIIRLKTELEDRCLVFAELRYAVVWLLEVIGLIQYCESFSPFPAFGLSVTWDGQEEMYEMQEHAEQQLRRLAGGEDV